MSAKSKTVLIDAFPRSAFRHRRRDALVCVDVMMTTTTLVSAVSSGRRAFVAATAAEAHSLTASLGPALLVGDPGLGARVPDSPASITVGDERPLVFVSPPGTELITHAAGAASVLVACFRNLTATAAHLARGFKTVAILAAGCRQEFSCEDQMAAAWIADALTDHGFEPEDRRTTDLIRRWRGIEPSLAALGNSAALLRRAGRGSDVDFVVSHVDDVPLVCASTGSGVHGSREPVAAEPRAVPLDLGIPRRSF